MAERFQVDALEMKAVVVTKIASIAQTPLKHKLTSELALTLMNRAVSQDNFTIADQLSKLALDEAQKAHDKDLLSQAEGGITEVAELAKEFENVKVARVTLEKSPDDANANMVMGKYLCFSKGDWDKGVPMLALGKDEPLKALAMQELRGAASSTEQTKLGDGWWTLAEKQEGAAKKKIQVRAAYWYQKALPGLSGLIKDKVEKRLARLGNDNSAAPVVLRYDWRESQLGRLGMGGRRPAFCEEWFSRIS